MNVTATTTQRAEPTFKQISVPAADNISYHGKTHCGLYQVMLVNRPLDSYRSALASLDQEVFATEEQAIAHALAWAIELLSAEVANCLLDVEEAVAIFQPMLEGSEVEVSEESLMEALEAHYAVDSDTAVEKLLTGYVACLSRTQVLSFIDSALLHIEDDLTEVRAMIAPVMVNGAGGGAMPATAQPLPVEPAAVVDWLLDSLTSGESPLCEDADEALDRLTWALDELVYQNIGTSKSVSDGINNQGTEAQVEALLRCAAYGEAPLQALVAELAQQIEGLHVDPQALPAWVEQERQRLIGCIAGDEADNVSSLVLRSSQDELIQHVASDLGLAALSYTDVRDQAEDRGLLDG